MTVEAKVEKSVCKACGADVRDGSMFCYNCGAAVAPELAPADGAEKNKNAKRSFPLNAAISKPDVSREVGAPINELPGTKKETLMTEPPKTKIKQPSVAEERVLKTAASVRRQPRPQPKNVEVVWEEENSPNALFIVAAVILVVFAAVVLLAMLYLR